MKQVQFRNKIKGTRGYNEIFLTGILLNGMYVVYDCKNTSQILTIPEHDSSTNSYTIEVITDLPTKDVCFLEDYVACLENVNYFINRRDVFEDGLDKLMGNPEKLSVLELVDKFAEYANCKEDYNYTLNNIEHFKKQLKDLEKEFVTYKNKRPLTNQEELINVIQNKTDAYLVNNVLLLTFEGQVPLRDLAHLLSHNGVMFNTDGLLEVELKTEGNMNDINYKVEVFYNIVQPLTKSLTNELIEEFNEATKILSNLDNK